MEYEWVREEIVSLINKCVPWDVWETYVAKRTDELADQILSLVEIKSDDQSLPEKVKGVLNHRIVDSVIKMLLIPDAEGKHWIRVIPKPKRKWM